MKNSKLDAVFSTFLPVTNSPRIIWDLWWKGMKYVAKETLV